MGGRIDAIIAYVVREIVRTGAMLLAVLALMVLIVAALARARSATIALPPRFERLPAP